jgi:hypothetical protein
VTFFIEGASAPFFAGVTLAGATGAVATTAAAGEGTRADGFACCGEVGDTVDDGVGNSAGTTTIVAEEETDGVLVGSGVACCCDEIGDTVDDGAGGVSTRTGTPMVESVAMELVAESVISVALEVSNKADSGDGDSLSDEVCSLDSSSDSSVTISRDLSSSSSLTDDVEVCDKSSVGDRDGDAISEVKEDVELDLLCLVTAVPCPESMLEDRSLLCVTRGNDGDSKGGGDEEDSIIGDVDCGTRGGVVDDSGNDGTGGSSSNPVGNALKNVSARATLDSSLSVISEGMRFGIGGGGGDDVCVVGKVGTASSRGRVGAVNGGGVLR